MAAVSQISMSAKMTRTSHLGILGTNYEARLNLDCLKLRIERNAQYMYVLMCGKFRVMLGMMGSRQFSQVQIFINA